MREIRQTRVYKKNDHASGQARVPLALFIVLCVYMAAQASLPIVVPAPWTMRHVLLSPHDAFMSNWGPRLIRIPVLSTPPTPQNSFVDKEVSPLRTRQLADTDVMEEEQQQQQQGAADEEEDEDHSF